MSGKIAAKVAACSVSSARYSFNRLIQAWLTRSSCIHIEFCVCGFFSMCMCMRVRKRVWYGRSIKLSAQLGGRENLIDE